MLENNDTLEQEVIHNNKDIFARIVKELQDAQSDIMIASAWFTDDELFDIVLRRAEEHLNVQLIIADNQENQKLDFSLLAAKGASIIKIKNVGYGMMHQKFCVIDKKIALHGSYNWSLNAKKNNHESVIVTNHPATVESLINNFNNIKEKAQVILDGIDPVLKQPGVTPSGNTKSIDETLLVKSEYEKVLDSMIAAEVSSFNRESLRKQGFDRSLANNGDHQVLNKALDTLYNGFINDIDVIEDKKRRLLSKIDEQKTKLKSQLRDRCDMQIETIETEFDSINDNLNNRIIGLRAEILINQSAVNDLKDNKIQSLKNKIVLIEEAIRESLSAFVKPGVKWFDWVATSFFTLGLFIYLQIFYSSAAYILLYSEEDALIALKTTSDAVPPQIFNPQAFSKAADHGAVALIFVCLFVIIPLAFAVLKRIMSNKIVANILTYALGMVVIDGFIAAKIAQAIQQIKSQTEINPVPWKFVDVFSDINFYLVFVMGAFGLLLFKFCFEKLSYLADERNPDVAAQRNKVFIKHMREDIEKLRMEISDISANIELREQEIIQTNAKIKLSEAELENFPTRKASQIENKKSDLNNKLQVIEATTDIYKSHVENDNIPVSIDALKDRINVFLEGWNDFLHQEYSIIKATEKSAHATEIALNWEYSKINKNSIDTRIKVK